MSRTPVRSDVYLQKYILHLHRYILLLKTNNMNIKIHISFEQLRMNSMQRTSAMIIENYAVLRKCFSPPSLSESASVFLILTTCFFPLLVDEWVRMYIYIIARENLFHSCKNRPWIVRWPADLLQRRPGIVRCRTVPGRDSVDVIIYRRQPAPVRYVTTKEKIIKTRSVSGRLSFLPVICRSLKSSGVSFICD